MSNVTLTIDPGQASAVSRLAPFFTPRSIAVVGASETSYWGRNVFRNLRATGFTGRLVPVNPKRETVFGLPCIPDLRALDAPVDLVYIAAPTDAVSGVLDDAAAIGIRNAVIIAAGFGEAGDHDRQARLAAQAHDHGITVLGPNCPGFVNIPAGVSAYGQEIPAGTAPGAVAIVLQSGALATVMMKFANAHGIGISKLVCMGNEAVTETADVLEYLIDDPDTQAIAMFVEQFKDGARFLALARKALRAGKGIVVLKAGRTPAGQRSALAHTGAVAGDEAVVDAALRQTGVARVTSIEELILTAGLFASGIEIPGARMAAVTASGGACDIIADRASDEGIDLPVFSAETTAALRDYLPGFATVQNPLDTAAVDTARQTGTAAVAMDVVAEIVSRDPNIDFILYLGFNVVPAQRPADAVEAEKQAARMVHVRSLLDASPVPIVPVSLSCLEVGPFARELYEANRIFMLGGIEFGMKALGHAIRLTSARKAIVERPEPCATPARPASTDGTHAGPWSVHAGRALLAGAGVPMVPAALVTSAEEAATEATQMGFPSVLKICSADIAHKSDIGGVALSLDTPEAVSDAFVRVREAGEGVAGAKVDGVLVSPMRPRGVELFAGVTVDPSFGPTLAVGLGGIWIETLKDVSLRVLPVTVDEVREMLDELRARPLLDGARGGPKVDIDAAARAIHAISEAALSLGDRLEALEVNPIWCLDDAIEALDALVITTARP